MKKFIYTLFFTVVFCYSYSQETSTKETKELFKIIKCRTLVNTSFDSIKTSIFADADEILIEQGIKNTDNNKEYFYKFLNKNYPVYSDWFYDDLLEVYSAKYSKDFVLNQIKIAKKNPKDNSIRLILLEEIELLLPSYFEVFSNDLKILFKELKGINEGLKLKIYIDDKISPNFDIELILNLQKDSSIIIYNNKNQTISLPINFNYELIKSMTIKFNSEEYVIQKYNEVLPYDMQELTSPLTKYCFEKIPEWVIIITDKNISFKSRVEVTIQRKKF